MAYIYDLTDTWNAGGTTFNGIKLNVTDSASAVSSKLVTLQTNGTEHFSVTKAGVGYFSGNVGIGTTTPSGKLQVEASNSRLLIGSGGSDNYYDADFHIFRGALSASAPERMRIDATGNVGIGTSSPTTKLDVRGAIASIGASGTNAVVIGDYGATAGTFAIKAVTGRNFTITDDYAGAERMRIDSSGNVGIGTSSPSSKLTVAASNVTVNAGYGIAFTGDQARIMTPEDNVYGALINWGAAGGCRFIAGTSERMRIDGSGNLLVGQTSGGLVDANSISIGPASPWLGLIDISHATGSSSGNGYMRFGYAGSQIGSISQSGTTAVLYNVTSDARLKENIANADNAASLIDAIQVRKFDWKADNSHQRYGFVAQELLEVAPEAVHQPADPDEMMAVDYSKLVPMLVKELQSLRARVAQLEGN